MGRPVGRAGRPALEGDPSGRGVNRAGRSPKLAPELARESPPGRNSRRGRNGLAPASPPEGRSVRGRKLRSPDGGPSARGRNGRSPAVGLPPAGRNGLPVGRSDPGRSNPPLRGVFSRGLSCDLSRTGSIRKPGVLLRGTKSSLPAGGAGRNGFPAPKGLPGRSG